MIRIVTAVLAAVLAVPASAHAAGRPTLAGNKSAAAAEAARLVALAPASLPAGAAALAGEPAVLAALPEPGSSLPLPEGVTSAAYWSVPAAPAAVLAWIKTHPPRGVHYFATQAAVYGSTRVQSFTWAATGSASWVQALLEIGVTADGGGTVVQAKANVVWVDPTPLRDDASGRRIHTSAAGPCPSSVADVAGVRNAGNDLRSALLPAAAPTAALICTYQGDHRQTQVRVPAARARRIAAAARSIPLAHLDGDATACPMPLVGTVVLVALRYPHRPDVDLWVDETGCGVTANGVITGPLGGLPALLKR